MGTITRETILTQLETIYEGAVRTDKWQIALRVTELQGYIGLFEKRRFLDVKQILDISEKKLHAVVVASKKDEAELRRIEKCLPENYPQDKPIVVKHPPP